MPEKVQIYQLVLDDGSDLKELERLAEQAQEQGGKVVEVSQLTSSISVGFTSNEKAPILQGGPGYSVEQATEVEAKVFAKWIRLGTLVAGMVEKGLSGARASDEDVVRQAIQQRIPR